VRIINAFLMFWQQRAAVPLANKLANKKAGARPAFQVLEGELWWQ
jgi:hypothetical protein